MNRVVRYASWGVGVAIAAVALATPTQANAWVWARIGVSAAFVAPGVAVAFGTPAGHCNSDRPFWGWRAPARVRVFVRFPYPHWVLRPIFAPHHGFNRHNRWWRDERREERWERRDPRYDRWEHRHQDRRHR